MGEVNVKINGKNYKVDDSLSILNACQSVGVDIPTLCYNPELTISGSCRLCLVEVEKARGLVTSCSTPVIEGMIIQTHSNNVIEARKTVLELLLSEHPYDCMTCEKSGNCKLQDYAYEYGVRGNTYNKTDKIYEIDDSNPFFERDLNKCVLCTQCTRVCSEVVGVGAISSVKRGNSAYIGTTFDKGLLESGCVSCGNCIEVCPVGALYEKYSKNKGRARGVKKVLTTCSYCGVGCQMYLHVKDNEIIKVTPADGEANEGNLCVKGKFGFRFVNSGDRLKTPLIKKDGKFVETSWKNALDIIEKKLKDTKAKFGSDSIAGLSSARCTNEENYLFQKMMRAYIGTNNVDHCARLCHASTVAGLATTLGSAAMTNSIKEIENSDVIFVIGSNTTEAHPVISYKVVKAVRKGTSLIVADPRKIDLAKHAKIHVSQNSGTDVALLNGMMNVIINEKLYNKEFVNERTEGFEELAEIVKDYTPEKVEKITGISKERIIEIARIYATAKNASILYSMGITQHTTGSDNVFAISNLAMMCGQIGRESTGINPLRGQNNVQGACDMGCLPGDLPGYQKIENPESRQKFEKFWGVRLSDKPGLTVTEIMNEASHGNIKAMYIMGENPMISDPDINHVKESLEKLDFLVVQDIFLTETAQFADVVLPALSFAEKEGTFTNTERRVQKIRKAVILNGEAKPDSEILSMVIERLGGKANYSEPEDIFNEIRQCTPSYAGITYGRLENGGLQWPCTDENHPGTKYLHKDKFTRGKGLFRGVHYIDPAELTDEEYPIVLSTGRVLYHYHTGTMTRRVDGLNEICPEGYVEINPILARSFGIKDGETVRVSSRRGTVETKALVTDRVPEKVVFMPFHFAEAPANMLTNSASDPIAKIPELKVAAVKVEKV